MNFYIMKTKAMKLIKRELTRNSENKEYTDIQSLAFKVETEYGFSEKFTYDFIEKLYKLGKIDYSKNKKSVITKVV